MLTLRSRSRMTALAALMGLSVPAFAQSTRKPDVHYVPTPEPVVKAMLRLANVNGNDVVYDLGCGDGRIVIAAARDHGARGVGVDIDPERIRESRENAKAAGVTGKVRFVNQDLFVMDFRDATVVTLYLLPSLNVKLRPKLFSDLKPGTRIVSHDFDMGDWKPDKHEEVRMGASARKDVYFWVIPAKVEGQWSVAGPDGATQGQLDLKQEYQFVTGRYTVNGVHQPIQDGRVNGNTLMFKLIDGETTTTHTLQLTGNRLSGKAKAGDSPEKDWSATRL